MKLQHTSGAVIEDARIEERGDFFYTVCGVTRGCIYSKADWRRVPEERFVKCTIEIERSTIDCILVDGERWRNIAPWDNRKYSIIDGNLCVERRVEGV